MMAESKFTPGPWGVWQKCGADRSRTIGAGGKQLAIIANSSMYLAEIEANAELIADAPRLLEVLRQVLTYADIKTSWLTIDEAEQAFDDANELIDKHGG
jgi:hypothetical protein